ncbi:MAG: HAD hydrolase-like protein, partial [Thermotaleaceae bacterium]
MDSIIFDLDGTLWDATEASLKAWNEVIKNYKEIERELTKKELESIMGLQIEEIGMRLFPNVPKERQQKILGECAERECIYLIEKGGRLYDNVVEVLNLLSKKYKLFIVSNCECGYIEAFFKYHKVDK